MRIADLRENLRGIPGDTEVVVAFANDLANQQLAIDVFVLASADVELNDDCSVDRAVLIASSRSAAPTSIGVWYHCHLCGARQYTNAGEPAPWCAECDSYYLSA